MKKLIITCTAIVMLLSIISACKKSDSAIVKEKTKILVGGKWTLTETHVRQKDGSWQLQPKWPFNNTLEFREDKTVTVFVNGSTSVQSWLLSADNSQLTIAEASGNGKTFDIAQLTPNVLQIIPAGYDPADWMHKRETYSR